MIFACALAILSLSCFVHAQETPAAEGPPAQTEDSGITLPAESPDWAFWHS